MGAGDTPADVAVSPDGRSAYVANSGDPGMGGGSVTQYDVGDDGALSAKRPEMASAGRNPAGVAVSPDGQSVYVTDFGSIGLGGGTLLQFDVGLRAALVAKDPPALTLTAGANAAGLAVSPVLATPSADLLTGTAGNNVIFGSGGSDRIRGLGETTRSTVTAAGRGRAQPGAAGSRPRAPATTLCSAAPAETELYGGPGRDRLRGGAGRDRLRGGAGRDRLRGGPGRDRLRGGAGRDRLRGGGGHDRLHVRGGGRDHVHCGSGRDTIRAGQARHPAPLRAGHLALVATRPAPLTACPAARCQAPSSSRSGWTPQPRAPAVRSSWRHRPRAVVAREQRGVRFGHQVHRVMVVEVANHQGAAASRTARNSSALTAAVDKRAVFVDGVRTPGPR